MVCGKLNRRSQDCSTDRFSDTILILPTLLVADRKGWTKFTNSAIMVW